MQICVLIAIGTECLKHMLYLSLNIAHLLMIYLKAMQRREKHIAQVENMTLCISTINSRVGRTGLICLLISWL